MANFMPSRHRQTSQNVFLVDTTSHESSGARLGLIFDIFPTTLRRIFRASGRLFGAISADFKVSRRGSWISAGGVRPRSGPRGPEGWKRTDSQNHPDHHSCYMPVVGPNARKRTCENAEPPPYKAPYQNFQWKIGPLGGPRPMTAQPGVGGKGLLLTSGGGRTRRRNGPYPAPPTVSRGARGT